MRTKELVASGALLLLGAWALAGCAVMHVSGGGAPREKPRSEWVVVTNPVATSVKFHPEVARSGDRVDIHLVSQGSFADEITEKKPWEIPEEVQVAIGFMPGMKSLRPELAAGGTLFALWYNICFLGTPTLVGLLIEPLNPNPVPMGGSVTDEYAFRRSALLGFHKFKLPGVTGTTTNSTPAAIVEDTRVVKNVTLEFKADRPFWSGIALNENGLVLTGVEPGRHEGTLVLKAVPDRHYLKKHLQEWIDFEMDGVEIPEK